MSNKSTFAIDGYLAVIPHIQNVYPPEKDKVGWCFGFKYKSGMYEFFTYKTLQEAKQNRNRLSEAIDKYWGSK